MVRRVLIYASIYGMVGAMVGAFIALYTKDVPLPKSIVLGNGSATKANSASGSTSTRTPHVAETEVAESPVTPNNTPQED